MFLIFTNIKQSYSDLAIKYCFTNHPNIVAWIAPILFCQKILWVMNSGKTYEAGLCHSEMSRSSTGKNWMAYCHLNVWKLKLFGGLSYLVPLLVGSRGWTQLWLLIRSSIYMIFTWQLGWKKKKPARNNLESENYKRTK